MGEVLLDGNKVTVDDVLTFDQLIALVFLNENVNGPVGAVTIQAVDDEGLATNWANIVVQNADGQAVGTQEMTRFTEVLQLTFSTERAVTTI